MKQLVVRQHRWQIGGCVCGMVGFEDGVSWKMINIEKNRRKVDPSVMA